MSEQPSGKICVICGEDCAGQSRTKDAKGHYYHQHCYDAAKHAKAAHDAAVAVEAAPPAPNLLDQADLDEPDPFALIDEVIGDADGDAAAAQLCPSCRLPVSVGDALCTNCGHSLQGERQVKTKVDKAPKAKRESSGQLGALLLHPVTVALAYLGLNAALFVVGLISPEFFVLLGLVSLVHQVLSFSLGVWILITAFREGIGQGFLTLCVPFYVIYFVFFVCDSLWIRYFFAVQILISIGFILMNLGLIAMQPA